MEWAELNNLYFIFDTKERSTFHSAAWGRDYNPYMYFVTTHRKEPLRH